MGVQLEVGFALAVHGTVQSGGANCDAPERWSKSRCSRAHRPLRMIASDSGRGRTCPGARAREYSGKGGGGQQPEEIGELDEEHGR